MLRNLLAAAMLLIVPWAAAEDAVRDRIVFLIDAVEGSPCVMIRNGRRYSGAEAAGHLRRKYDYYRGEIQSVAAFIDTAATRSEISGKDYRIACPGEVEERLSDWLYRQLDLFQNPD